MDEIKKKNIAYNYDLAECNLLFKRGISPIGVGFNDNTQTVFHVFVADQNYFISLDIVRKRLSGVIK